MPSVPKTVSEAEKQVELGNFEFKVISTDQRNGKTFFYITTPFELRHNGIRDRISASVLSIGGRPTKRGLTLFNRLRAIPGVEPSLDEVNRQLVTIVVDDSLIDNEHWARATLRGLPRSAAIVLQSVSMGV